MAIIQPGSADILLIIKWVVCFLLPPGEELGILFNLMKGSVY